VEVVRASTGFLFPRILDAYQFAAERDDRIASSFVSDTRISILPRDKVEILNSTPSASFHQAGGTRVGEAERAGDWQVIGMFQPT
jgi:hypothetical protein